MRLESVLRPRIGPFLLVRVWLFLGCVGGSKRSRGVGGQTNRESGGGVCGLVPIKHDGIKKTRPRGKVQVDGSSPLQNQFSWRPKSLQRRQNVELSVLLSARAEIHELSRASEKLDVCDASRPIRKRAAGPVRQEWWL